jgi:hypothetical protein
MPEGQPSSAGRLPDTLECQGARRRRRPGFTEGTKAALIDLVTFMNGDAASQLAATQVRGAKFPLRTDGIADLNTRKAIGAYTPPAVVAAGPVCVGLSVGGAGSNMDGYPRDIVIACDRSRCYDQPIGSAPTRCR